MKTKNILLTTLMSSVLFIASQSAVAAPVNTFMTVASQQSFAETTQAIQEAATNNQMMVMGKIDQAKVMSMTGLKMEGAQSFLIGSPQSGKKLFSMFPAAGAVVPVRLYVWEQNHKTSIGWFNPAQQLTMISPKLQMPGKMLEKKIMDIAVQASRN